MLNFDRFVCTCNSWVWMYMTPVSGSLKVIPRVESESVGGLKVTLSEEALKEPPSELMNTEEAWVSKLSSEFSTRKKLCTWLSYQSGLQSQDTGKYSLSMESEPYLVLWFPDFWIQGRFSLSDACSFVGLDYSGYDYSGNLCELIHCCSPVPRGFPGLLYK